MKNSSGLVSDRHLTYSYDGAGNILSRNDANGILSETYAYDERNRLVSSTALNAPERSFTFEYDDFNNITRIVKNGTVKTYEYDDVKVHSLKSVREGSSYKRYSYNENGDVTLTDSPNAARSIEYDALNRVTGMTVTGADKNRSWNYSYDSDGERIKKSFTDPETGKHMTTVYWFSDYEETFADDTLQKVSKLYGGYAQRVTEYDEAGTVKEDKLDFIFKDILGSPVCTLTADGTVKDTFVYEPFGKMLPNENADSLVRSFTSHFAEDDEGLYYCHARWYDADIGRFLQADSVLDGLNRYAYCADNPIRFADPTGMIGGDSRWPVLGLPDDGGGSSSAGGKGSQSSGGASSTPSAPATPTGSGHGTQSSAASNSSSNPSSSPTAENFSGYPDSQGGKKSSRPDPKGSRGGQSASQQSSLHGDVVIGVNASFVACVGLDVSIGFVFDLDNDFQSGLFLSGGFAAGASAGISVFGGYTNGDIEESNNGTVSIGIGAFGGNVGVSENLNTSLTGGYSYGIRGGINFSRQHCIVIPFDTPEQLQKSMDRYYEHH